MRATLTIANNQIELDGNQEEIGAVLTMLAGGRVSAPARGRAASVTAAVSTAPRARKPVSAAVAKQRKLQGRYMGLTRTLPAKDKAQVKALAKDKGVAEALKLAEKFAAARRD